MSFDGEFQLGFLALTDAAPLLVASRRGMFEAEGLNVALRREISWATLRDKLAAGILDGAHILAPLALSTRLGLQGVAADLIAPLNLNANGAAATLSPALALLIRPTVGEPPSAAPLKAEIARRRERRQPQLCFGVVFPISTHAFLLREWLAAADIDPDTDVRLRVLPPTAMVDALSSGELDGFCVGAPWNAAAEAAGVGRTVLRDAQVARLRPDKVFAVSEAWAERNDPALQALLRALIRAARWADDPANRDPLLRLLSAPDAVNADAAVLARDLERSDEQPGLVFAAEGLGRPKHADAEILLAGLRRWCRPPPDASAAAMAAAFYRPDLFERAERTISAPTG